MFVCQYVKANGELPYTEYQEIDVTETAIKSDTLSVQNSWLAYSLL